jgi:two-component system, NtrC family, sensor histidine kinase PilS
MENYFFNAPINRKNWFLALRFLIPALLIGSGLVFLPPLVFNYSLLIIYGLVALAAFLYNALTRDNTSYIVRGLVITLLAAELLIEGLLVNHVGGNFSPFMIFFIITIVTAGVYFHFIGSIVVATLAGSVYSLPIFFNLSTIFEGLIEPTHLSGMGLSSDEAFYTVFLHLCLFYISAFISGYLTENLNRASHELSKIRLETNEILEQMRSGLITIDSDGRIVYFNKAAGDILSIDHKLAKGRYIRDFFHAGLRDFISRMENALESKRSEYRIELNIKHPLKGILPIGLSLSILNNEDGNIRGIIAVFQDLTEAKKLEAHLRVSDRLAAVGRLAAGIAHEIRNPLASISGSVEVLKDDLKLEGDDLRLLELILKESSRLNTILTDFLNFARVGRASESQCNLASVILEVVALASAHQQENGLVRISHNIHKPNIQVWGGEDQLKQIIWNLLVNSIQALPAVGGEVFISTEEAIGDNSGQIKLIVADNGPGIPDDIKEKIFEPFFSTKDNGTGLGLPIIARIVDCLDGKIEVGSEDVWKTIFTISLPVAIKSEPAQNFPNDKIAVTSPNR